VSQHGGGESISVVTTAAMARALQVKHSLSEMGMPESRMHLASLAADESPSDEVRVYVQTGTTGPVAPAVKSHATVIRATNEEEKALAPKQPAAPSHADATQAPPPAPGRTWNQSAMLGGHRPLVTIRFDGAQPDFRGPLHNAVQEALKRRPGAHFDLVVIAPGHADFAAGSAAAMARAQAIADVLTEMGLPANRLTVEATAYDGPGIETALLFVR